MRTRGPRFASTFYTICVQLRRRCLLYYRAVCPAYVLVLSISSPCSITSLPCSPALAPYSITAKPTIFPGQYECNTVYKSPAEVHSSIQSSPSDHIHTQPNAARRHCTSDHLFVAPRLDSIPRRILARILASHRPSVHHRERLRQTEVEAIE
jgi:hypothetical protein